MQKGLYHRAGELREKAHLVSRGLRSPIHLHSRQHIGFAEGLHASREAAALARLQQKRHLGHLYTELVEARRAPKRASEK